MYLKGLFIEITFQARENACEFQEFHAIYFSKLGQLVKIRHKKLVEGRGGRDHT